MTIVTTETQAADSSRPDLQPVVEDLYRDIHKGIRAELFAVTADAGRLDPDSDDDRAALASHVRSVTHLLVTHAEHEDGAIDPVLDEHLPELAARIRGDHERLDTRLVELGELAEAAANSTGAARRREVHRVYVELASFTSAYLQHQDLEERIVMPALETVIGPEAVTDLHQRIVAAIPPDDLVRSLAVMFPAMNVDDLTEMLGGMQAEAPADVFGGVWGLARSVLPAPTQSVVARRLAIG